MQQIVLIFHFVFCLALIGLVLLQKGKGAGMGTAFGSGASSTVFGSKGSGGFLMKFTIGIAALFFITSISLTYMAARQSRQVSKTDNVLTQIEQLSQMQQQDTKKPAPTAPVKK
jgi:preprotein translocase subunit SecG